MAQNFNYNKENKLGEFHCIVTQEPWNDTVKVYLAQRNNGKLSTASIEGGELVMTELKGGKESKPMLVLPYMAWETILGVLGGIPSDIKQESVDAELKATKHHLEDMRTIVFDSLKVKGKDK